ncbi:MAG: TetR/AcrR family transcriptional regulator [bacterium]
MNSQEALATSGDAKARIVDAGIRCVIRDGMGGASMSSIAAEGGVSKALLHYHFADRAELLAEVVTQLGRRIVAREALAIKTSNAENPVDAVWRWVQGELACGELRALLALATVKDAEVRHALADVSVQRHAIAAKTVMHTYQRLALVPRFPAEVIAGASLAFLDGLALDHEYGARDPRVSFDVLWLALLGFGE